MWFHRHKLWKTLPNRTGQIYVTPMALCGSLKSSPGHQRCKWPLGKGWGSPVSRAPSQPPSTEVRGRYMLMNAPWRESVLRHSPRTVTPVGAGKRTGCQAPPSLGPLHRVLIADRPVGLGRAGLVDPQLCAGGGTEPSCLPSLPPAAPVRAGEVLLQHH